MIPLKKRWAIVGAGRVGCTLGLLAKSLDIEVDATWNRSAEAARRASDAIEPEHTYHAALGQVASRIIAGADVIWLTLVDTEIAAAAATLAPYLVDDQLVLHTAGSLSSQVLREAGVPGPVASLHPLLAITDPVRALDMLGQCAWTVEGDRAATDFARALLHAIGVAPVEIDPAHKALYHASAVTSANLMVALMDAAFAMAERAGMTRAQARQMMLPLARSCIENLERQDTPQALSGPAARGDLATIARHIEALQALDDPQLADIYQALSARALRLADT